MFRAVFAILLLVLVSPVSAQDRRADISGRVVNARDGEPLDNVQIALVGTPRATVTSGAGAFRIDELAAGPYVLEASAVGYHPVRQSFSIVAGESKIFEIVLTSSTITLTESATVTADAFSGESQSAAGFTLEGHDIANLGSVLADDPLRAVKSLPGVTANNDFSSEFSVRGAPFSRVGLYFDGILLHAPFHTTDGVAGNGSLSIFSGDLTDEMTLFRGAWPVRYGDRTAGVVDVTTRPGTRERTRAQVSAGASNVEALAEGPLGGGKRGAWVITARRSYLQYILNRIDFADQPPFIFGFADAQGRIDFDLRSSNSLSLSVLDGRSSVDRSRFRDELSPTTVATSDFHTTVVNAGWRYLHPKVLVSSHAAFARERGTVDNREGVTLSATQYTEGTVRSDATIPVRSRQTIEAGGQLRRLSGNGESIGVLYAPQLTAVSDGFRQTGWQAGAYAMDTIKAGPFKLAAGLRYDSHTLSSSGVTSPYASLSMKPREGTRVQFDWGQYGQFPELAQFGSRFVCAPLRPERAAHVELMTEQRLDARTRLLVGLYNRQDRDLLARPFLEPRLSSGGAVTDAQPDAPWANAQRGYARGFEVTIQRQAANGFRGWTSYAYGRTEVRDVAVARPFPSDYDQRHTVNAFVSRRFSPTVNVSGQMAFGSGMPLPGFYRRSGDGYALAPSRNQVRAPVYHRTDVRVNKALVRPHFDATLFVELVNVTNRTNRDFDSPGPYDPATALTVPTFFTMFPILPSAGIVIRFGRVER